MGGLRSTDVKNFGRILKNCLDLPNTVRQCDIPFYVIFSVRFPHSRVLVLPLPFFLRNYDQSLWN